MQVASFLAIKTSDKQGLGVVHKEAESGFSKIL